MATLIRATCGDCGDVELGTSDLVVRVREDDGSGSYVFRCPRCALPVVRPADAPTVELLIGSGCELQVWTTPRELDEPRPAGPAFTHDDLLAFHEQLAGDGWYDDLISAYRPDQ